MLDVDPKRRRIFKTANFREGVEKLEDLEPGMVLEGVVTNVAAFGAFVDVGVHQDGLPRSPKRLGHRVAASGHGIAWVGFWLAGTGHRGDVHPS